MDNQKHDYRRGGWFLMAATVVAIVLATTLDAPIAALIAIGAFGFGGGIVLIALGDRRED